MSPMTDSCHRTIAVDRGRDTSGPGTPDPDGPVLFGNRPFGYREGVWCWRNIAIALTDPVGDRPNSQSAPGYNNYRFRVMQKEEAAQISGGSCSLCRFS